MPPVRRCGRPEGWPLPAHSVVRVEKCTEGAPLTARPCPNPAVVPFDRMLARGSRREGASFRQSSGGDHRSGLRHQGDGGLLVRRRKRTPRAGYGGATSRRPAEAGDPPPAPERKDGGGALLSTVEHLKMVPSSLQSRGCVERSQDRKRPRPVDDVSFADLRDLGETLVDRRRKFGRCGRRLADRTLVRLIGGRSRPGEISFRWFGHHGPPNRKQLESRSCADRCKWSYARDPQASLNPAGEKRRFGQLTRTRR